MSTGLSCRVFAIFFLVFVSTVFSQVHALPTLSIGPFNAKLDDGTFPLYPGTLDGSAPYDVLGGCADTDDQAIEGEDCGGGNGVVRTQDVVSHVWSITADNYDAGAPNLTDVVIEQTITPSANGVIKFESLPVVCTPTAGGGTNPTSGIVENADGSSIMTCNLGEFSEGQQKSFTATVKISGMSWNGSDYSSSQRVYSMDAGGAENATPATYADVGPIKISAAPAYDLVRSINSTHGFYNTSSVSYKAVKDLDGDGTLDSEPGFYTYGLIRLAAARKTGIESLKLPIVFQDTFKATALAENGADYPLELYINQCLYNQTGWGGEVFGREGYYTTYPNHPQYHAIESGTCDYVRNDPNDPTSLDFTVTIDGADLSGNRYPTKAFGGIDLTAGPYYATDHRVQYWMPFRSVDMTDGIMDDQGSVYLSDVLTGFDPDGVSGVSNYGSDGSGVTDVEPGYDGADMNGLRGNNRLGPTNYILTVRGSFSKRNLAYSDDRVTSYAYTGKSSYHAGDGELEPEQTYLGWVLFYNNGTKGLENAMACDVFDNTVQHLVDRGETGGTAGTYAYMGTYDPNGFDYTNYTIEYAHIDLTGDDPIDIDHDGTTDYDTGLGRYRGDWDVARAARCDDGTPAAGWFTDATQVPGGIDAVNATRARLSDVAIAAGVTFDVGQEIRFVTPLKIRESFKGGVHDGQMIPVGTVAANFGSVRSDNWSDGWTSRSYQPSPENGSVDGDRVTITRIKTTLDSQSLTPLATPGNTASTLAGEQIVWKVVSSVQSTLPNPSAATNLRIIDVLPPEATYNAICTSEQNGGTPASLVEYNTDKDGNAAPGYTRLTWSFGDVTANTVIPPRIFCTDTDPLAINGTSVVNYAEMRADNVITALSVRSDTHSIKLEQTGSIQVSKKVDMPLDDQNLDQVYEIAWSNFAPSFGVDKPTVIDVFSYTSGNGDGDAKDASGDFVSLAPRNPASDFSGKFVLTAAPTIAWLDGSVPDVGAGDPDADMGVWTYSANAPETIDYDPDANTAAGATTWCLEADFGSGGGCPANFDAVTAIKFVSNYDLKKDGDPRQGMKASYTMQAGDSVDPTSADINFPGDIYTNRFAFDSATLPADQYLRSNNVSVQIAAFSIGDLVFADVNGNGKYDAGTDGFVPDETKVELYKVADDGTETKIDETTTGALGAGRYLFEPLASGKYYVKIPATEFQVGGHLIDWDIAPPTGTDKEDDNANDHLDQHGYSETTVVALGVRTGIMELSANPPPPGGIPTGNEPTGDNNLPIVDPTGDDFSNMTLDIGLKSPLSSLGNIVWTDANNNGLQDVGELGLSNVTVNLLDKDGNQLQTTRTDNDGHYNFSSLVAGDYIIEVIKPTGYAFSAKDAGADDTADSDTDTTSGRTDVIIIAFGQHDTQWDSGLYELGSIGDRVWVDTNNDGVQDLTETAGLAAVTAILKDSVGIEITRIDTDDDGKYLFTGLAPADYIVDIDEADAELSGYTLTTANDPKTVSLGAGENYLEADFGYINYGSVGNYVWHDTNGNGEQEAGEAGIEGVTVRLLDSTGGAILKTTTTVADGSYLFTDVPPEDYIIEFVKPNDYTDFVTANLGGGDATDSDATQGTGRTATFTLAAGENRTDIDAGLYKSASLGNFLWLDADGNNVQDAGEVGLANIAVNFSGNLGNGQLYQVLDYTTDANGQYQFTGLYPGAYTVGFGTTGFVVADQGGDDTLDSDAAADGKITVTLASGDNNQTLDAGIAAASVTGRVWIDNNTQNGIDEGTAAEDGVVGVTVNLIDPATGDTVATTTTGADGVYNFTGVNPASYLIEVVEPANMGFVAQDQGDDISDSDVSTSTGQTATFVLVAGQHVTDIDAGIEPGSLGDHVALDLNNNGIQDAGEPGVEGIVVTLIDAGGATVDTKTTDATGFYNFAGVVPANYTVHFEVPANMSLATANAGSDDTVDFDTDANGDVTVVVVSGQGDQTIDAGIVPATLGDTVWFDKNGNGSQDATEIGVADIVVTLVDSSGADVNDAGGNAITATTDANGNYSFNVLPGTYAVKFTLPADMAFTTKDAGTDDAKDSDADTTTGITATVTVASGDTDSSLDAGVAAAVISGTVLSDANGNGVQEAADTAIESVTVTLTGTDIQGNSVDMTTTTGANGAYQFNVLPGTYTVVETNPVGLTSSGAEQGSVGSEVLNGDTITVTVKNGETSENNDFLDFQPASLSGQVREDKDGDADTADADTGIAGVEIILWKDTNGDGTADVVYANTTTNGSGDYSFNDIPPGSYIVVETDLDTYTSTADTDAANDNRIAVTLASGETSPNHDFLDTRTANISGQVRKDVESDGNLSDAEAGIPGLTITLYTDPNGDGDPADGAVLTTTTTDAQGDYQFNNVLPGNYVVVETDGQSTSSTADVDGANDNRVVVTLEANTDSVDNDFLDASERGSLSGVVWMDVNADGTQDSATEAGIPNVTVIVKGAAGNVVTTLTTDANGAYFSTNLDAGNYTVEIIASSIVGNVAQTGDPDSSLDDQTVAAVTAGNNTGDLDFGYVESGTIGDKVWLDANADGIQDVDEAGIANLAVKLLKASDGTVLATTTTDINGNYQFTGLMQDTYKVQFVKPASYGAFTLAGQGPDTEKDSELIDAVTGQTGDIVLAAGEVKTGIDAGLVQYAQVGDTVWFDLNNDGIQDINEPNVPNVTVKINGTPSDGSVFAEQSTITDSDGHYQFTGLLPGDYTVEFVLTAGMSLTTQDQGADDAKDSDAAADGKVSFSLISGQTDLNIDAGILPAEVTGRVWIDNNTQNGIDEGVASENGVVGVNVNLIDVATGNAILSTTTGADGIYTFTGVLPAEYIVEVVEPANMGFVSQDQGADDVIDSDVNVQNGRSPAFTVNSGDSITDIDAGIEPGELGDHVWLDENNNGLQDSGEPGVADVTVTLTDVNGAVVSTQTTDATGFYNFTGVLPADYTINFTLPNGMTLVEQDRGTDDSLDSDANVATGDVAVTVISGVGNQTIDAGVIPATIGDTVWFDKDNDGLQGESETMLAGITVNLLDTNGSPVSDAGGNAVTTTTDENGKYNFTVLPGSYAIEVDLPAGVMLTGKDAGDDAKDSDTDPVTKKSDTVTVVSGDNLTTLDAGIKPATISGSVITDNNANGTEDADDTVKIPNVTVAITGTDSFGNPVTETVTTDVDGNYTANVPPGTYTVTETTPDTYTSTGSEAGTVGSTVVDPDTLTVTVNSGENSENNDFLERLPASLSGQVRDDTNGDGDTTDATDQGVAGVEIILWSDTDGDGNPDAVVANTTTNATGNYEFTGLAPGTYIVIESDPQNSVSIADTDAANDNNISVTLSSGEQSPNHDFIDTQVANISGQVRDDTDRDGALDDTDAGIAGVTITLFTDPNGDGDPADGIEVATDATDAQGNYLFTGIVPGSYVVVETDPEDYQSTTDITAANDNRVSVTHVSATDSTDNDFLDTSILASLSGVVWSDTNPDGTQDAGTEDGIPNVTVLVKGVAGNIVATLTTDANGAYSATDLPAGNYIVEVVTSTLPAGSLQTGDPDNTKDHMTVATVISGNNTAGLDFGYVSSASIGDTVWHDTNADGIQDADEIGIANVAVKLLDSSDTVIATTTTDATGNYLFTGLMQGSYKIEFVKPENYAGFTKAEQGGDVEKDSDIVDNNGRTQVIALNAAEQKTSIDAGLYQSASLGDTVWFDSNGNGVQDADETGVEGVLVQIQGGWSYSNSTGSINLFIDTTVQTDANGKYLFESLLPANYSLTFTLPNGMAFTAQDQASDDVKDSDVAADGKTTASLLSGQTDLTLDAGVLPAEITGRVWIDNNTQNGIDEGAVAENGVVGVNVNLIDVATGNAVATTTGAGGIYTFSGVMPSEYIVEVVEPANMGFVTNDQGSDDAVDSDVDTQNGRSPAFTVNSGDSVTDIDAGIEPGELGDHVWLDENNNGVQDSGEPGVAGVTVTLTDANGAVVSTQTTDATGFYNFTGVLPADYTINFTLPNGMTLVEQDRGTDDSLDSDANVVTGDVAVTVISGVGNQTVDAGVIPATIGDTVWFDKDNDGLQGESETPLAGITVNLLDTNGNPVNDAGGNAVTIITDENGKYSFTVLPGSYAIELDLPAGVMLTGKDTGDDAKDSDTDPATKKSDTITVVSGDNLTTLDAGIKPATISGSVITDNNANGTEDADDTVKIPNVTITITGSDSFGNPVTETVITDADGNYTANVPPGTYTVTETTPDGYTSTGSEAGTVGSTVVDPDTLTVTVNSGENSENNDFLERLPASLSGQVRDDTNGDGDTTDATDTGVAGVEVILWSDTDGDGNPDAVIANTTTNATGNYEFADLAPGKYIVVESDPTNTVSTADTDADNDNLIAVMLASGEQSPNHDFIDTQIANISGQVRDDADRDADLADTEKGIAGVTVTLYTDPNGDGNPDDGIVVATDGTDEQGNYLFTGIVPGNYVLVESDPTDYQSTADIAADNDNTIPAAHVSATDSTGNDFLDTSILGSLSGVIWLDTTPDGTRDTATETGIPSVTVWVKDAQGVTVATLTTDANGVYQAADLPAGNYTVEVDPASLPAGSIQTGDPDANLDDQSAAVVVSGENTADLDFGYVVSASLGDKVWEDLNADGIQGANEPAIAGAAVTLMMMGNEVATTLTDADGLYHFTNLKPAEYEVIFTTPANYYPTMAKAGADDIVDSDPTSVDMSNSKVTVTVVSGDNPNIDAGFYQHGNLGNQVWLDWNSNGVQDDGEPAVSEMTVNLLNADGTPAKYMNGDAITTMTNGDGQYNFTELKPADYLVEFVAPNGIVFTAADQGDDAIDSDAQANGQAPATVTSNQTNDTVDAGILPAAVSGRVWIDNNTENAIDDGNATENGVVGVTVNLIDSTTGLVVATTTTGAEGEYSFTMVLPGDYLVEIIEPVNMELVIKDQGGDDTTDSDVNPEDGRSEVFTLTSGNTVTDMDAGILPGALGDHVYLDSNENGLQDSGEPGVEGVTVNLLDSTGATVETQVTDVTGFYNFNAELPGEYTVEFVLPNGMAFTTANTGSDDTIDSDADTTTGKAAVTVVSGVTNQTVDAGIIPAKIGNMVWLDKDGDGTQGGTEPVIPNVTVTLLDAAGEPAKDKGGNIITTTTDAMGHYQFIVEPATYGVQFTLPENTEFTTLDSGGNDAADSDADLVTGKTATITVNSGDMNMTLDAGIKPASITGHVLQDNNGDAAEDAADTKLVGVTVTLTGTDVFGNPITMTATTDENGDYKFTVPPGSYAVTETNPESYTSSVSEAGTIGSTIINKDILNIDVKSGEDSKENDFLDYQVASLSGQVREDMNGDADTTTATDPAIETVEVILWRDTDGDGVEDVVFANTVTDADGNYSFTELPPGAYIVIETDKDGFKSTADTTGDNDNKIAKVLASGEDSPNHDFLDTQPTIISGQVREDEDRDGDLADADNPLNAVTVTLYTDPNGDGNPDDGQSVDTVITDENGNYHFDDVTPGNYVIVESDPEYYGSTGDTNGEPTDNIIPVTNVSGENNTGNDLLDTKLLGTVAGTVWDDENADGTKDLTEPKLPTVIVVLLDENSNEVATTTTNGAGEYQFIDLIPADYTVLIKPESLPDNTQQTGDPDVTKDHQHTVTVPAQTDVTNIDFGYVVRGSIGNKVWHDVNANGAQDADELGISGVKVLLLNDAASQPIATTETNADGEYLFTQLLPADYFVKVEMPVEYDRYSQTQAGADAEADSDVNAEGLTTAITLAKAQDRTDIDAGVYAYASVGNTVWLDKNDDDLQQDGEPGVENIAVTLTGTNAEGTAVNETIQTDVNGHYNFANLVPGDYELSFAVTSPVAKDANGNASDAVDSDIDANGKVSTTLTSGEHDDSIDAGIEKGRIGDKVWEDMNGDGIQDADEPGIAGAIVTLYSDPNSDGNPDDGEIIITTATDANGNYLFDGLLPDDYVVAFTTPENHTITPQDQKKDDVVDSDINVQGQIAVTISSGEITTIDAGFYQLGSVGDRVWLDADDNGFQDADEPSVFDIPVALYDLSGNLMTDVNGIEYKTITDANGNYRFDNLIPSEYQVRFTVPEGITFTQTDHGADDATDSDANANGQAVVIIRSGEHNPTVDAGLTPAAITGRIWIDNNEQNHLDDSIDDEAGLVGMVVNLLNEAGEIIQSTTTGSDGVYTFDTVLLAKYQVEFVEPDGMTLVQSDQGSDDTIDSDADIATGRTPLFDVTSGQTVTNLDAGIEPGAVGDRVWLDANENGIQDADEIGVAGIVVHLLDAQSLTIASTTTDENGFYSFKDVVPANYTILFERPADMHFIEKDKGSDDTLDSDVDVNGAVKVTVHSGTQGDQTIDAGIKPAFIGDTVWLDSNIDDLQTDGEKGLQGITVLLNDKQGNTVDVTVTDVDGHYNFVVIPGDYQVLFIAPDSTYSNLSKGNNDNIDSDVDESGLSHIIEVESGEKDYSVDAGILPAMISGKVLDDKDADGVEETGDTPLANTTVTLTGTDSYGNPVTMTTTTNEQGEYEFIVPPGTYTVTETNPEDFVSSTDDVLTVTVVSTDISENNNFLDYQLINVSGKVEDDKDGDISASEGNAPLVNTDVTLWVDPNGDGDKSDGLPIQIVPTNDQGQYLFENVVPGNYVVAETDPTDYVSIGELVGQGSLEGDYLDGSTGADVNNNELPLILVSGVDSIENNFYDAQPVNISGSVKDDEDYDADFTDNDPALIGVTVSLYTDPDGNGDPSDDGVLVISVVTDDQGNYVFEDINPGLYVIVETDPTDYNSTADTGLDGNNNNRIPVIIFSGEDVTGQNFLDTKPLGSFTGQVQNDTDNDGDTTDPDNGVVGVTVELWTDPNGDGNTDDGEKITSTITDDNGNYIFTDIIVGNYVIVETDRPGYLSTGDTALENDNRIPVVVSMDKEQHCHLPTLLRSNALNSCTGLDLVDREKITTLTVAKKVYKGHDAGIKCGTDEAKDEIVLVDIDKDLQEPATFCFEVTNTGENYLSNIVLDDAVLGINQSAMTALSAIPTALAPNTSIMFFYDVTVKDTIENTVDVSADAVTEDGTSICSDLPANAKPDFCTAGANDNSKATVHFVFDPPSAIKTVTESGQNAMVWQMVWINSSPIAADVEVYDAVPEGTHFYAMEAGGNVSADGVYCEARGSSVTDSCTFEAPSAEYPRGRILWIGTIGGDVGAHTEDEADNEVVIRMMTVLDDRNQSQEIVNQAHSSWDMDGDGENEFDDVPTGNGNSDEPTTIQIGTPMKIPSMSFWGLLFMSLMIAVLGAYRRKR